MICELIEESGSVPAHADIEGIVQAFFKEQELPEDHRVYIIFLDDEGIIEYNRQFFSRETATDVISVNLEDTFDDEYVWGEIYVSTETARRIAEERDADWELETVLYIVHGLFHLQGFEDETEDRLDELCVDMSLYPALQLFLALDTALHDFADFQTVGPDFEWIDLEDIGEVERIFNSENQRPYLRTL